MYKIAVIADKGSYKDNNEDRVLINENIYDTIQFELADNSDKILLALCDGVGGENAGEVAAFETLKVIRELNNTTLINAKENIKNCVAKSVLKLTELAKNNINYEKMATTLTGIMIEGNEFITFNIGDSRVYRYRNGALKQLTIDHTVVQELKEQGVISLDNSNNSNNHIITRYINSSNINFEVDIFITDKFIEKGDIFLICSDGIHDFVDIDSIENILYEDKTILNRAIDIFNIANSKEKCDNISLILLEIN